jgi:GNAT superfamily N-acetyltransferase
MTSWSLSEDVTAAAVTMRDATRDDVPRIVALYRTDEHGNKHDPGGDDVEAGYYAAFDVIQDDARNRLIVAELSGVVAGSFQLTWVPDMNPDGREVALIENVIVDSAVRGHGVGSAMMRWAVAEARAHGCYRVTLTSRNVRQDAHRFYARLGFEGNSVGFKLYLDS